MAEFLAREDGAFDDDIDVGIQEPAPPAQRNFHLVFKLISYWI